MFENRAFYHEHIRKIIAAFGIILGNLVVNRKNSAGAIVQSLVVPLTYMPKNKMLSRILEAQDLEGGRAKVEITLPRMAYIITRLDYDTNRKLNTIHRVREPQPLDGERSAYMSTPYNIGFNLSIFAKNQDDGMQIIEQILPYFNPDFNITIHEMPDLKVQRDIQFVLDGVSYSADYEGAMENNTTIVWDLHFTVKMNFFGYVNNSTIIRRSIVNLFNNYQSLDVFDQIGTQLTATVDPIDALPTDFDIIETHEPIYSTTAVPPV